MIAKIFRFLGHLIVNSILVLAIVLVYEFNRVELYSVKAEIIIYFCVGVGFLFTLLNQGE